MSEAAGGILFVLSAPSGTGKSTVSRRVLRQVPGLEFSVSYTTRAPREGEVGGKDYHFVEAGKFERMVAEGAFLEWARVFEQHYGTGIEATREVLARGRDVLLDIDVQGARQVMQGPLPSVTIMLLPPDYATLERRLHGRHSEPEAIRVRRLAEATREVRAFVDFDYVVINDDLNRAVGAVTAIVRAERCRSERSAERVRQVIETFPE